MPHAPWLVSNDGKLYELVENITKVGRSSANTVVLTDSSCSRSHAEIRWELLSNGKIIAFVKDLGTVNGTFCGPISSDLYGESQKVDGEKSINFGDFIQFGVSKNCYQLLESKPQTSPIDSSQIVNGAAHSSLKMKKSAGQRIANTVDFERIVEYIIGPRTQFLFDPSSMSDTVLIEFIAETFMTAKESSKFLLHSIVVELADLLKQCLHGSALAGDVEDINYTPLSQEFDEVLRDVIVSLLDHAVNVLDVLVQRNLFIALKDAEVAGRTSKAYSFLSVCKDRLLRLRHFKTLQDTWNGEEMYTRLGPGEAADLGDDVFFVDTGATSFHPELPMSQVYDIMGRCLQIVVQDLRQVEGSLEELEMKADRKEEEAQAGQKGEAAQAKPAVTSTVAAAAAATGQHPTHKVAADNSEQFVPGDALVNSVDVGEDHDQQSYSERPNGVLDPAEGSSHSDDINSTSQLGQPHLRSLKSSTSLEGGPGSSRSGNSEHGPPAAPQSLPQSLPLSQWPEQSREPQSQQEVAPAVASPSGATLHPGDKGDKGAPAPPLSPKPKLDHASSQSQPQSQPQPPQVGAEPSPSPPPPPLQQSSQAKQEGREENATLEEEVGAEVRAEAAEKEVDALSSMQRALLAEVEKLRQLKSEAERAALRRSILHRAVQLLERTLLERRRLEQRQCQRAFSLLRANWLHKLGKDAKLKRAAQRLSRAAHFWLQAAFLRWSKVCGALGAHANRARDQELLVRLRQELLGAQSEQRALAKTEDVMAALAAEKLLYKELAIANDGLRHTIGELERAYLAWCHPPGAPSDGPSSGPRNGPMSGILNSADQQSSLGQRKGVVRDLLVGREMLLAQARREIQELHAEIQRLQDIIAQHQHPHGDLDGAHRTATARSGPTPSSGHPHHSAHDPEHPQHPQHAQHAHNRHQKGASRSPVVVAGGGTAGARGVRENAALERIHSPERGPEGGPAGGPQSASKPSKGTKGAQRHKGAKGGHKRVKGDKGNEVEQVTMTKAEANMVILMEVRRLAAALTALEEERRQLKLQVAFRSSRDELRQLASQ